MSSQYIPLGQTHNKVPLGSLGQEARHAEPACLPVLPGAMGSADSVLDDVLPGSSRLQFRLVGETAGDDHAGNGARGGGAEATRGLGSGAGKAQGWAQRSKCGHGSALIDDN